MNHHRVGITAVILLAFISIIYFHEVSLSPSQNISQNLESPYTGESITPLTRGNTEKKQIIFTFDGGEGNESAGVIMDILDKHHTRGTFFLTGKWVERNSDLVRRMRAEGHEIYNHTLSHFHLPMLDDEGIARELTLMDQALLKVTGYSTKPYFRPPFGDYDSNVLKVAARNGYRAVMWTVDAGDWMESQGFTDDEARARIFSNIVPGSIILMHVGDAMTGRILDGVLTKVEEMGYTLVPLSVGVE